MCQMPSPKYADWKVYHTPIKNNVILQIIWSSHRGVMANVQDRGLVVSEFEPHPRYWIHFQINNLGKEWTTK